MPWTLCPTSDNATRNRIYQSIGLYDGKVVDANGLVLINKAGA